MRLGSNTEKGQVVHTLEGGIVGQYVSLFNIKKYNLFDRLTQERKKRFA